MDIIEYDNISSRPHNPPNEPLIPKSGGRDPNPLD